MIRVGAGGPTGKGGGVNELVYGRSLLPTAERAADQTAVIDGDFTSTYQQHLDRVLRLSSAMKSELGVQPGDRFAVMSTNNHQFFELYHAAFLGAGVINPLNLRLAPRELEFILKDSGTKVCFVDGLFGPLIDKVRDAVGLEKVVLMGPGDVPHDVTYEEVLAAGEPTVPPEPAEDGEAILMYTGGTTGLPKGVLLEHRAVTLDLYK